MVIVPRKVPSDHMAAFLLSCRTTEVAPNHFEARVFVVPAGEGERGIAARSECRMFESAELASTECARMAEAMERRLIGWGHEVRRVAAALPTAPAPGAPTSSGPACTP